MKKSAVTKRVIVLELIGFTSLICIIWADEVLDVPHHVFGAAATPINWVESIFETVLVFLLGMSVVYLSNRFLQRIKYLEGILPICAFCKKIRVGEKWIPVEEYVIDHSDAHFTHGFCPECGREHYGEYYDENHESVGDEEECSRR
ncbi:MAG: hypothetical protein ABIH23_34325 [bacterium]